jgi:hypothetical protein
MSYVLDVNNQHVNMKKEWRWDGMGISEDKLVHVKSTCTTFIKQQSIR